MAFASSDHDGHCSKPLSWRGESSRNFSDWTVVIESIQHHGDGCDDDDRGMDAPASEQDLQEQQGPDDPPAVIVATYHVHRNVLAIGPRSSKYFYRLFHNTQVAEAATSSVTISLPTSAAAAVPDLLDYMYEHKSKPLQVKSGRAVALKHLADYFQVPLLMQDVQVYIATRLNKNNLVPYLRDALEFNDEETIIYTKNIASRHWRDILSNTSRNLPIEAAAAAAQDAEGNVASSESLEPHNQYLELLPDEHKTSVLQMAIDHAARSTVDKRVEQPSPPDEQGRRITVRYVQRNY